MNRNRFEQNAIYLAGKVQPLNDWRSSIVPDYELYDYDLYSRPYNTYIALEGITHLCYVGPFLVQDKPHMYYRSDHGTATQKTEEEILSNSLNAIDMADIVFAWIDDITCYGTLVELGYAKAKGKTIWIAGKELTTCDDDGCEVNNDLWFAYNLADELLIQKSVHEDITDITPRKALEKLLLTIGSITSPIEIQFWNTWQRHHRSWRFPYNMTLSPQHPIDKYRVDFAHVETKIAIELDGFASHSSTEDIANDRRRQREIEAMGWRIIRYGGKEIHSNVHKCVQEAYHIILEKAKALHE